MSQNAPSATPPKPPAKTSTPDAKTSKKKEDTRMSNPATRAGTDPLAGMNPCGAGECEVPQGTLQARMDFERQMDSGEDNRPAIE